MTRRDLLLPAAAALAISACALPDAAAAAARSSRAPCSTTYADIAAADLRRLADHRQALQAAVEALIASPERSDPLAAADAWIAARVPYMQTEAFRFGNAIVDDWEGRVNSWPLDEGLIDYVVGAYGNESPENDLYVANVIANTAIKIAGEEVDTSKITKELLADKLQEAGGVESNVATGYHAIEFLLWGQDLNGTGPGAGNRPHRLRYEELHERPLRPPRAIPRDGDRPPGRRSRLDGRAVGTRRRRRARR